MLIGFFLCYILNYVKSYELNRHVRIIHIINTCIITSLLDSKTETNKMEYVELRNTKLQMIYHQHILLQCFGRDVTQECLSCNYLHQMSYIFALFLQ